MIIRNVNIEDFNSILDLQLQLEDTEIVFDNNLKEHAYDTLEGRDKLKKRIENKNNIFLVAEIDNNVIAFIDGNVPDDEWWYKEKIAYLNHLCVDKNYRRQGIATELISEFQRKAKEKDAIAIRLLAFPNNVPAVSFYKKNNYSDYSVYYSKKLN